MGDSHRLSRRHLLTASAGLAATGCFGSFNLTGVVYDWNGSFSSKWVRWLIFLVLIIVPVYEIVLIVDALVLNTIEFWTGDNPVHHSHLKDGTTVVASKTSDPKVTKIEHRRGDQQLAVLYCERVSEHEMILRDARGKLLARARSTEKGTQLLDGHGRVIADLSADHCRLMEEHLAAHRSPTLAVRAGLEASGADQRVSVLREELRSSVVL